MEVSEEEQASFQEALAKADEAIAKGEAQIMTVDELMATLHDT